MKRLIVAIPKGYKYLEISLPNELVSFVKTKAIKDLPNGLTYSHVVLDEANELPKSTS